MLLRKIATWCGGQLGLALVFRFLWQYLPKGMIEGAGFTWIDDQIAALLGMSSSQVAPITPWIVALILASMILALYHWVNYHFGRSLTPPIMPRAKAEVESRQFEKRDVWLLDAVWRAFKGEWFPPAIDRGGSGMGLAENQRFHDLVFGPLHQYSFDGDLPIWAKRRGSNLWEKVPSDFWRDHLIEYFCLVNEKPEDVLATRKNDRRRVDEWREFMTSRAAVERLWSIAKPASKLKITGGETGNFFSTKGRGLYQTTRILSLRIENKGSEKPITDIRVVIAKIEPQTDWQGDWILVQGLSLAAGQDDYIPFVKFGTPNSDAGYSTSRFDRADSFVEVLAGEYGPTFPKGEPQIISLMATGFETAPCEYKCRVWVDPSTALLRIEDYEA